MHAVYAEQDMVVFRNYRNAIWLIKSTDASDASLKIARDAELDWKHAKKAGTVVSLAAGTRVEHLSHRYADIGYRYAKRELLFTTTTNGKHVFMPYWEDGGVEKSE